jgi:hypothetical protein
MLQMEFSLHPMKPSAALHERFPLICINYSHFNTLNDSKIANSKLCSKEEKNVMLFPVAGRGGP